MNDTRYILQKINIYDSSGLLIESRNNMYTTKIYNYSEFERPQIIDCQIINDEGFDSDGNGLYDYLLVNISLNVSVTGNYTLRGYLYGQDGNFICMASNYSSLTNGTYVMPLFFSGEMINHIGQNGSYNVSALEIYDENNMLVFTREFLYFTSNYNYSQFETMLYPDLKIDSTDIHLSLIHI